MESEGYVYSVAGKGSFVNGERTGEDSRIKELKETFKSTVTELLFLGVPRQVLIDTVNGEGEGHDKG